MKQAAQEVLSDTAWKQGFGTSGPAFSSKSITNSNEYCHRQNQQPASAFTDGKNIERLMITHHCSAHSRINP
jgi:hypothetical protein